MLHCAHALAHTRADAVERNARLLLTPHAVRTETMRCAAGSTLEVALAQVRVSTLHLCCQSLLLISAANLCC